MVIVGFGDFLAVPIMFICCIAFYFCFAFFFWNYGKGKCYVYRYGIAVLHTKDNGVIYERGYVSNSWGAWSIVYAGAGKLLWSGTTPLSDTQTITLTEAISAQQNGIVVVFSPYNSSTGSALTYGFNCHYIPKQLLSAVVPSINSVLGVVVTMAEGKFASNATKFLRITDTTINGSADNTATGTANGITYNNNRFALRYVIGV